MTRRADASTQGQPSRGRRRALVLGVAAVPVLGLVPAGIVLGQNVSTPPAPELLAAMAAFAGNTPIRQGRVHIDIAELVDNGNTVPISVKVDSPMSGGDRVVELALFNEKNPQRDVVRARLGTAVARAEMSTRIRLATTQKIVAMARMADGSVWAQTVDVIVTLAACIEEAS